MDKIPEFMTPAGIATLSRGYLLENETVEQMYRRLSSRASAILNRPDLEEKFFDILWKGWLCPASPVISNFGTERGLPISCYSLSVQDSVHGIYDSLHEVAMLTKNGGGIGTDWDSIRPNGAPIKGNGTSTGVIPWLKIYDSAMLATNQGAVRRGSMAAYLSVEHKDVHDFLKVRLPKGDINRQCLNIHNAIKITDSFMQKCEAGDEESLSIWKELMYTRVISGEPYMMFVDTAQRFDPPWYKDKGLSTKTSNLCNEIYLHTDGQHSFVCCLSSMNIAKFDEWKDTDAVQLAIYFLDAVMQEFIDKAKNMVGFERAYNFAVKSRALGLGWLGYHTYLQQKGFAFDSLSSMLHNKIIAQRIHDEAWKASKQLAIEYGEPEWCKGHGIRNTHLIAIAPTANNSIIAGQVSPGIEPIDSNIFAHNTAKGTFIVKNPELEKVLEKYGKNDFSTWELINSRRGSVQHLDFLSEEEKEVFRTAREINQFAIVKQAGDRQKFVCQGQSVNLFFSYPDEKDAAENPKLLEELAQYISDVHKLAWKVGLKGLYYLRSEGAAKGDVLIRKESECMYCES